MKNLEISSTKSSTIIPKWIILALVTVSFVGFLDATYLTASHYLDAPLPCSILEGCEQVTNSEYAVVFGIPVALGGVFYYLSIFILSVAYLDIRNNKILYIIPPLTAIGFLASVWFVYLQLFIIKAICPYCMLSAATSTILFILGIFILKYTGKKIININK